MEGGGRGQDWAGADDVLFLDLVVVWVCSQCDHVSLI